jgi:hypothetical protein
MKGPWLTRQAVLKGLIIYSFGDSVAALLLGQFSPVRCLGIALVGGTLYALEIPTVFRWIDGCTERLAPLRRSLARTSLALLYFSPLWITRHLVFIKVFSGKTPVFEVSMLGLGLTSFLYNIPLSFGANFLIQNKVPLRHRFLCSAVFSALMAVYYALSETFFR